VCFKVLILNLATEQGLYISGESLLHRLDPRVKVLSCLLLVVLAFAATDWPRLFTLVVTVAIILWLTSPLLNSVLRLCWMLRWFLLFTLLMHLLLSPGRTLWGSSWLSLDGLLMGTFVCVQMLLAIMTAALLAMTTSTEKLTGTFGWFVQPLQWLGCKTEEWQKILLLTMNFIPVVQEEIHASRAPGAGQHAESAQSAKVGRWSAWVQALQGFLLRLVNRGDAIAYRVAAGEDTMPLPKELPPFMPMALRDQLFSLVFTLAVICYWLAG
jgi:energy-coupling factor transport system permease protein